MSDRTAKLAAACEAATRVIIGAAKPSKSEKDYLVDQLRQAASELRGAK